MGTYWKVQFYASGVADFASLEANIIGQFDAIIEEFSLWNNSSFLSRLNTAPAGTCFPVSDRFQMLWSLSVDLMFATQGAFSPAVTDQRSAYSLAEIAKQLDETGLFRRLEGVHIDLTATAKGLAIDLVAALLRQADHSSFLIDIGGDIFAEGIKPDKTPYWIELDRRASDPDIIRCAPISEALASSGQLQQAQLTDDGYTSHIRGHTGAMNATVTVLAANCMIADGWATALLAAGEKGPEIADENCLVAAFCESGRPVRFSKAAQTYLA